jgi:prepilin-type processing-associated H-X9-DG protein
MYLWPYIEQSVLSQRINTATQPFYTPPCTVYNTMNGLCGVRVPLYYCPSDSGADLDDPSQTYCRARGNYVVNWGNAYYDTAPPAASAPFAHIGGHRYTPLTVRIASITDGTSNTLMMSELLMATSHLDNDWRGDIQNDDGTFRFHTLTTPNSTVPDQISVGWEVDNHDPLMPVIGKTPEFNAARSRHTGGVNVAMCDGSVQFITNSIALSTWQALGTMNGGEVVSNFLD